MKLTKIIREAFVRSVMNDVPQVDYVKQYQKLYQDAALAAAPPEVRALYPKHKDWLLKEYHYFSYSAIPGFYCYGYRDFTIAEAAQAALDRIEKAYVQQCESRQDLETKLTAVAQSCTTCKALAEALPEFEKYLPAEAVKGSNLPALANVMTDFMKAGWPKDRAAADVVT